MTNTNENGGNMLKRKLPNVTQDQIVHERNWTATNDDEEVDLEIVYLTNVNIQRGVERNTLR
ncbi:hypothetical protein HAX54_042165, partial [Datura stramonium]|nr:hypothetical protein [Datura stramonium]